MMRKYHVRFLEGKGAVMLPTYSTCFLDNSDENLRQFERTARNMQSLAQYSRSNQINKEWIDDYLNEAHSFSLTSIRAISMSWHGRRERGIEADP